MSVFREAHQLMIDRERGFLSDNLSGPRHCVIDLLFKLLRKTEQCFVDDLASHCKLFFSRCRETLHPPGSFFHPQQITIELVVPMDADVRQPFVKESFQFFV